MKRSIELLINQNKVQVDEGASVLDAARTAGIYIPALCAHPEDSEYACRLCIVEVEGQAAPVTACTLQAAEGMIVWTDTPHLARQRRRNLARLLQNHPSCCLNCPRVELCDSTVCQRKPDYEERCVTCAKDGRCELQKAARYIKLGDILLPYRSQDQPRFSVDPLFDRDYNLCIGCGQCVTACKEILGVEALLLTKNAEGRPVARARLGGSLQESGCKFCGVCAEVCPTSAIVQKIEKEGAMAGRPDSLVPCRYTCPAGIDVPRYVKHIADGDYSAAYRVIRSKTPFAGTLAHVCPHPCEDECRRLELNNAIAIRALKRYAVEHKNGNQPVESVSAKTGKRVAIVGAGPAGLTTAYHLARLGHDVSVFEASGKAGGMMWWGIPRFQLPADVLQNEIAEIAGLGVKIHLETPVEDVNKLFQDGFQSVFLGIGLQQGKKLPIPGAEGSNIFVALDFLAAVNSGNKVALGQKVVILGGGDVAVDCALAARRLGAKDVAMAFLESREQIPAHGWMVEEAEEEGVKLHPSLSFTEIIKNSDHVEGVKCLRVKWMQFDLEGKLQVETVAGSDFVLDADTVIFAVGQGIKPLQNWNDVQLTVRGTIAVADDETMETSCPGIFAGGDAVSGPASIVEAIKAGRSAARAMDIYLGGEGNLDDELLPEENGLWLGSDQEFYSKTGNCRKLLSPEKRTGFEVVELSLGEEEALLEAARCLRCDLRVKVADKLPLKAKESLQ